MGANQVNSAAYPRRAWLLVLIAAVSLLAGAVWVIGDYGGKLRLSPASQTVRREQATGRREFPRTATDAGGAELILPAPPQRIASQALATDHFLFSLVPHERIVAVSQFATDSSYSNIAGIVRQLSVKVASDTESVLRVSPDLFLHPTAPALTTLNCFERQASRSSGSGPFTRTWNKSNKPFGWWVI